MANTTSPWPRSTYLRFTSFDRHKDTTITPWELFASTFADLHLLAMYSMLCTRQSNFHRVATFFWPRTVNKIRCTTFPKAHTLSQHLDSARSSSVGLNLLMSPLLSVASPAKGSASYSCLGWVTPATLSVISMECCPRSAWNRVPDGLEDAHPAVAPDFCGSTGPSAILPDQAWPPSAARWVSLPSRRTSHAAIPFPLPAYHRHYPSPALTGPASLKSSGDYQWHLKNPHPLTNPPADAVSPAEPRPLPCPAATHPPAP